MPIADCRLPIDGYRIPDTGYRKRPLRFDGERLVLTAAQWREIGVEGDEVWAFDGETGILHHGFAPRAAERR